MNLKQAATSIAHLFHTAKLALRGQREERTDREVPVSTTAEPVLRTQQTGATAHHPRRDADIPFELIENAYTPTQTSMKAGFRDDGADRQRDQEFATGVADDRWNDEDRFTNRSGDPRIGTHGRTYEPGEARAAAPAKKE